MNVAKEIKPVVKGKSDFFSWQLYRFVKRYPAYKEIWQDPAGALFIGSMKGACDYFLGRELRGLCRYGSGLQLYAYHGYNGFSLGQWKPITHKFWIAYLRKGVCAIHGDWAHKWVPDHSHRKHCAYCGRVARLEIKTTARGVWTCEQD